MLSGVRLTRQYIGGMLARGTGRVVFISSRGTPAPELPHGVTKAMELSISRNFAELTKGTGYGQRGAAQLHPHRGRPGVRT